VKREVDPITGEKTPSILVHQTGNGYTKFWLPAGYTAQMSFSCNTNGIEGSLLIAARAAATLTRGGLTVPPLGELSESDLAGVTTTHLNTQLDESQSIVTHNDGIETSTEQPGILSIAKGCFPPFVWWCADSKPNPKGVVDIAAGASKLLAARRLLGGDSTTTKKEATSWTDIAGSAFSKSSLLETATTQRSETYSKVTQASATGSMYTIEVQSLSPNPSHSPLPHRSTTTTTHPRGHGA
jgi:hypothetical protein